jgi:hypothetical protein
MVDEEKKVSRYSSGINILMRINDLWKDTHSHSRQGNFAKWNADLDRVWLELARELKDSEEEDSDYKEAKKKYDDFEKKLSDLGNFDDSGKSGFKDISKDDVTKRNNQYKVLMDKQIFLARLENEMGIGTSYDEEDEDF